MAYEESDIGILPTNCSPEQVDQSLRGARQLFKGIQPVIEGVEPLSEDANEYPGGPQIFADDLLAAITGGSSSTLGIASGYGGAINGADFSGISAIDNTFAGMPNTTATVYLPQTSSGVKKWDDGTLTGQTIYNMSPWYYPGDGAAWVRKTAGVWVIERDLYRSPCAYFSGDAASTTINRSPASWLEHIDHGRVADVDGAGSDRIVITAKHDGMPYTISWSGWIQMSAASNATLGLTIELYVNGVLQFYMRASHTAAVVAVSPSGDTGPVKFSGGLIPASFTILRTLGYNSYLELKFSNAGAFNFSLQQSELMLTPMGFR